MKGILADINIQGQVDLLVAQMQAEPWKLYWDDLGLEYHHFSDVGLALSAPVRRCGKSAKKRSWC